MSSPENSDGGGGGGDTDGTEGERETADDAKEPSECGIVQGQCVKSCFTFFLYLYPCLGLGRVTIMMCSLDGPGLGIFYCRKCEMGKLEC
jgi:hypothetical protein